MYRETDTENRTTSIEINDIDKVYQAGGNSIHAVESLDLTI
jgi:hypothetical protein